MHELLLEVADVNDARVDFLEKLFLGRGVEKVDCNIHDVPGRVAALDHHAEFRIRHRTVLNDGGASPFREALTERHLLRVLVGAAPAGENDFLSGVFALRLDTPGRSDQPDGGCTAGGGEELASIQN